VRDAMPVRVVLEQFRYVCVRMRLDACGFVLTCVNYYGACVLFVCAVCMCVCVLACGDGPSMGPSLAETTLEIESSAVS
jgi:hypothetical protein